MIWQFLVLFGPFIKKWASEKSPEILANSNDATLTRRHGTRHAEAPENIFHFVIGILDFDFTSLPWLRTFPQGLFFPSKITRVKDILSNL